ncbi:MAG: PfkB family carbohydrate kinase [Candidatus Cloacimonadaceae bacterium]|nr:PfkB family carbohydrate kinase [Candidatus Cloacimonadaceae bacterium]MDP3113383.1 PfkB family carbohydrate kinase [Candidatus Cloacimonadaceae bacterium]
MSLVVVGSIGLDSIQTPAGKVNEALGGSSVYASIASSYFTSTHIVGVVGDDFPPRDFELLRRHKINLEGLETFPGKTFRWSGIYEDWNHATTISTDLNVFADFSPKLPQSCKCCRSLLLGNIHPALQLEVLDSIQSYDWVACDTMNYWISGWRDQLTEVIKRVDIMFVNEEEIRQYTAHDNIFSAASAILDLGVKLVVIKRGEYGSVAVLKDDIFFAPAYPVREVQDPTGAGDCFAGGFMGYLATQEKLSDLSIRNAIRRGTVMAALNVEAFGVHGIIDREPGTIDSRVKQLEQWT